MSYAPIAIFVYRRPEHTSRMLESLKVNEGITASEIYIFADGIKNRNDKTEVEEVEQVRKLCLNVNFAKKVNLSLSEVNCGLADSIIAGVTKILESHGRVIVLEDDLELSPKFLKFMNSALDMYEENEKVFHISGYWFPVKNTTRLPKTFFYNTASCWGWATWKRAWDYLETDPHVLKAKIQNIDPSFSRFNFNGHADFLHQLNFNIDGRLKTWAIKWYASMFINEGFALHPNVSYVNNIGHDSSGENCGSSSIFNWKELATSELNEQIHVVESLEARKMMIAFYKDRKKHPFSLGLTVRKLIPSKLKKLIKSKLAIK